MRNTAILAAPKPVVSFDAKKIQQIMSTGVTNYLEKYAKNSPKQSGGIWRAAVLKTLEKIFSTASKDELPFPDEDILIIFSAIRGITKGLFDTKIRLVDEIERAASLAGITLPSETDIIKQIAKADFYIGMHEIKREQSIKNKIAEIREQLNDFDHASHRKKSEQKDNTEQHINHQPRTELQGAQDILAVLLHDRFFRLDHSHNFALTRKFYHNLQVFYEITSGTNKPIANASIKLLNLNNETSLSDPILQKKYFIQVLDQLEKLFKSTSKPAQNLIPILRKSLHENQTDACLDIILFVLESIRKRSIDINKPEFAQLGPTGTDIFHYGRYSTKYLYPLRIFIDMLNIIIPNCQHFINQYATIAGICNTSLQDATYATDDNIREILLRTSLCALKFSFYKNMLHSADQDTLLKNLMLYIKNYKLDRITKLTPEVDSKQAVTWTPKLLQQPSINSNNLKKHAFNQIGKILDTLLKDLPTNNNDLEEIIKIREAAAKLEDKAVQDKTTPPKPALLS